MEDIKQCKRFGSVVVYPIADKFGIRDESTGEDSGPRYRNQEYAEKIARAMDDENKQKGDL